MVELVELFADGSESVLPACNGQQKNGGCSYDAQLPGLQLLGQRQQPCLALEWKPSRGIPRTVASSLPLLEWKRLGALPLSSTLSAWLAPSGAETKAPPIDKEMRECAVAESRTTTSQLKRRSSHVFDMPVSDSTAAVTCASKLISEGRKRPKLAAVEDTPLPQMPLPSTLTSRKRRMHERDLEDVEVCLGAKFERLLLGAPQCKVVCRRASA